MTPRLSRIVSTDWPSLACVIAVPVLLVASLVHPLAFRATGKSTPMFLEFGVPAAATCLGVLVWRIRRVLNIYGKGNEFTGRVTRVQLTRDRGRIEFEYRVGAAVHTAWQPVHKTANVTRIIAGQQVKVLALPSRANTAIIRALFEDRDA